MNETEPQIKKVDSITLIILQTILTLFCHLLLIVFMQLNIATVVSSSKLPEDFSSYNETDRDKVQKAITTEMTEKMKTNHEEIISDYYRIILEESPSLFLVTNFLWLLCFLVPGYLVLIKIFRSPLPNFNASLDFKIFGRGILAGIITFIIVIAISIMIEQVLQQKLTISDFEKNLFIKLKGNTYLLGWSIYTIAIITGIIEELYFRGFLLTQFAVLGKARVGVIFTSFLFGALHYSPEASIFVPFLLTIVGYFFGSYYLFTGNIWIPIISHICYNSLGLIVAYFVGAQT
ncbi:MAG: type II CAAX endopeptidase family protein [Leptospiraceae bacterium]|nr:type II CAAX endopeptidase family protein [Leptospiraceae bacterium]